MRAEDPIFGQVIYSYTRAQAIEDGVLVDVTETAREAGFKVPVALTSAVWNGTVELDEHAKAHGESVEGRLWDVLWMARFPTTKIDPTTHLFSLLATFGGRRRKVQLKAVCGPGDNGEPVVTIMEPQED